MLVNKIYVSGPISGYHNGNIKAFRWAQEQLLDLGYQVVVPHDVPPHAHEGICPVGYAKPHSGDYPRHDSTACFIRGDLRALLTCDAIYLLRGWERSVGARAEFEAAAISGLAIYYEHAPNLVSLDVLS